MRTITTENWGDCCCGSCIKVDHLTAKMQFEGHFSYVQMIDGSYRSIVTIRYDYEWTGAYMVGTRGGMKVDFFDKEDTLLCHFEHDFTETADPLLKTDYTPLVIVLPSTVQVEEFEVTMNPTEGKMCSGHKKWKFNGATLYLTEDGSMSTSPQSYDFKYTLKEPVDGFEFWTPIE